jgi:RNA polymerase sigma-70 factor (ECF subfamily)
MCVRVMAKDSDTLGAITASMEPDSSLLAMVQQGHEQAMARLFERHSKLVYSVALRVLRDPAAAEDVLQELFMQIWRTPTSFIGTRGNLGGWLAVVSRNRSVDLLRKKRPTESFEDVPFASPYDLANDAEQNLMLERVRILVAELPDEQRKALEMAFFEGLTHLEIAKKTECPLGTVKTRIRSAVQTLGKAFRP